MNVDFDILVCFVREAVGVNTPKDHIGLDKVGGSMRWQWWELLYLVDISDRRKVQEISSLLEHQSRFVLEMASSNWESIAAAKRQALLASIPSEWRIPASEIPPETQLDVISIPRSSTLLSPQEVVITAASASQILEKVKTGQWTAATVTKAFCKRAAMAHQLTNCLSETMFDVAFATAQALDEHLKQTGTVVGPLHGLPISLKDNFNVIGKDSTDGFVSWVNDPAKYNSALVDLLIKAGAIIYVKTNVPTAMMIAETVNNTFGRTVNPRNRKLTSGGSSGGESSLIAFGGSVLGVGTDIGGSLRIPAACTGIFTLRPSFGRFPTGGAKSGLAGQEAVNSVNGPLARSLDDIELFSSTVVGLQPWLVDPKCLPVPWRTVQLKPKLKLGVMWHDGIVLPTPPVQRALAVTVDNLRHAGHEIVEWKPELHKEAIHLLGQFFVADGGKSVRKALDPVKEPFRPEMEAYSKAEEIGVYDLWQLQAQRTKLCTDYLAQWHAAGIDGLLCPTTPFATTEHGKFKYVGYTGVFNVLDYSATSFPTGIDADSALDKMRDRPAPLSDTDAEIQREYNAEAIQGMPISLQLVAQRLEEEKVLAMTRLILQSL